MKTYLFLFLIIIINVVRGQGIALVTDLQLISLTTRQLAQIVAVDNQLTEANRVLAKLVAYEGDPSIAVKRMDDLSSFVTNVGSMGMPRHRADVLSSKVNVATSMRASENEFRQETGAEFQVYGKRLNREEQIYASVLRMEGVVQGARRLLEENRAHQHTLLGRLSTANDHLESSNTVSQIMASQAEILRLGALMQGAQALAQNLESDVRLKETERSLAIEDRSLRLKETRREEGKAWSATARAHIETFREMLKDNLQRGSPAKNGALFSAEP